MKRFFLIIALLVLPLVISGCTNNKENDTRENDNELNRLEAIVKEVDRNDNSLFVEGVGEDNSLGDEAIINIANAKIIKNEKEKSIDDIKKGDRIAIFVDKIATSYPAKASTEKVIILESESLMDGKVFIKEGPEKITIRSENIDISKLSLIGLDYDAQEDTLLEKDTLKEEKDIRANTKTTWEVVYSEGIPSMKLVWELSNGDKGEYIIAYDGKDGIDEDAKMVYPEKDTETNVDEDPNEEVDKSFKDIKLFFISFDETDLYLVEETHKIENVAGIARLTLENLRDSDPKTKDAINPIYERAKINGINIENGLAIVDFSKEIKNTNFGSGAEAMQVQAIVNTLTQFPTIDRVEFTVDGSEDIEKWLSHIGNVYKPFTEDTSLVR